MEKFQMSFITSKDKLDVKSAIEGNSNHELNGIKYCVFVFLNQSNYELIDCMHENLNDLNYNSGSDILLSFIYRENHLDISKSMNKESFQEDDMSIAMKHLNIKPSSLPCICIIDKSTEKLNVVTRKINIKKGKDQLLSDLYNTFDILNDSNKEKVAFILLGWQKMKDIIKQVKIEDLLTALTLIKNTIK
jgi:hypothetical protein